MSAAGNDLWWKRWRNPVLREPGVALKDPCCAWHQGSWHWFYSRVQPDAAGAWRFSLAGRVWSAKGGWQPEVILQAGCASPNLSVVGGRWCLTYCTYGETHHETPPNEPNQLYFRTSHDLCHWSEALPLACELTRNVRAIDPALIEYAQGRVLLVWKERQTPCAALGQWIDPRAGPTHWQRLPPPDLPWFENAQLLEVDGHLQMVATLHEAGAADSHRPARCDVWVTGTRVCWGEFQRLAVPPEAWNPRERANAAYVLDRRAEDGWFYLVACGRSQGAWHSDGDYALGLYRSRELSHWETP